MVSSRRSSASKITKAKVTGKQNDVPQHSSPPTTPGPTRKKATPRARATPKPSKTATKDESSPEAILPTLASPAEATATPGQKSDDQPRWDSKGNESPVPANTGRKRKRAEPPEIGEEDGDMLPHNMGKPSAAKPRAKHASRPAALSRKSDNIKQEVKVEEKEDTKELLEGSVDLKAPSPKKRTKKAHPYGLTPGETPFPDWPHPTAEEAQTVHDLLMARFPKSTHGRFTQPDTIPPPSEQVAGCGEVPTILDALIRTLLSAATSGRNSSAAFQGLVKRFGLATHGAGRGSVNWNAVHEAPLQDVFEAIKMGGLAANKSKNIKKILDMVHTDNSTRRSTLTKSQNANEYLTVEQSAELKMLKSGALTLDYYHVLTTEEAINTFSTYPGIGVKTASCVALFCMQRPSFAVDTHVFRLCQYLGWVPPESSRGPKQKKVDRNTTFSHCEVRIPDHLKYGLHQLLIEHGKHCPRCRAITGEGSAGWEGADCPIEHLVKRLGKRKGGADSPKKKTSKKKGAMAREEEEEDEEMAEACPATAGEGKRRAATPRRAAARARPAKRALVRKETEESEAEMSEEDDAEMSELTDAPEAGKEEDDDDEAYEE
ncbi:hypothetical protein MMC21_006679 [Puttea exsequens]|nr:hypothetical protein [Puttea exsequens]